MLIAALIAMVAFACGEVSSYPASVQPAATLSALEASQLADQLANARAKWANAGVTDYSFRVEWFCANECYFQVATKVTVRSAQVENIDPPTSFAGPFRVENGEYLAISQLFDVIGTALAEEADSVEASYDRDFGYPTHVAIDNSFHIVDDELAFFISDFVRE